MRRRRSATRLALWALAAPGLWLGSGLPGVAGGSVEDIFPSQTFTGDQFGGQLGFSVGTAGDVNADGYSDVVVGAPLYDAGGHNEAGQVRVYIGSPSGLVEALRIDGPGRGARFGEQVSSAGDVNGDGYDDLVVGAPGIDTVFVYYGGPDGLTTPAAWQLTNAIPTASLGAVLGRAGDVNGDGFDDLVFGTPGAGNDGLVRVYCGSADGPSGEPWLAGDTAESTQFGQSVATAGDFNGDGYSDILIGARGADASGLAAYVYFGGRGTLVSPCGLPPGEPPPPDWVLSFDGDTGLGSSVASVGDVNGDGFSDIVVGSQSATRHRVVVAYGSPTGLRDCRTPVSCEKPAGLDSCCTQELGGEDGFGMAVASAGDWNGDGFADLVVGAPDPVAGRAELILGARAGFDGHRRIFRPGTSAPSAAVGMAVASAGDINGDGFGDVVVGAPEFSVAQDGGFREGAFYVFYGSGLRAPDRSPDWVVSNDAQFFDLVRSAGDVDGDGLEDLLYVFENRFGWYRGFPTTAAPPPPRFFDGRFSDVRAAGDLNGDGYGDLLAGEPTAGTTADPGRGRVVVYYGNPGSPMLYESIEGVIPMGQFGQAVASAGDVDGDGFGDFIVGAPGASGDPPRPRAGAVTLFRGSPDGPTAAWRVLGDEANSQFGAAVAGAGDVNGDGFGDIVVGAPCSVFPTCGSQRGRSFVYLGSATGLSDTPVWTFEGPPGFGSHVLSPGDVNGDGFSDVTVGREAGSARTWSFLGSASGLALAPSRITDEDAPNGLALAGVGDVDGDGRSDLLVGTPFVNNNAGRIRLYRGSEEGLDSDPALEVDDAANASSLFFGHSVAAADLNGDGFSDLIAVGMGRALVFYGNRGGVPRVVTAVRVDRSAPVPPHGVSDRADAVRIAARAHRVAGDGSVGLEFEIKPLGKPFDGADLVRGMDRISRLTAGRTASPDFALDERIDDLDPHTYYRWRARVVSDSPSSPRSPWFSPLEGGPSTVKLRTAGTLPSPVFAPLAPKLNQLITPDTPPMIFVWNRGSTTEFRIQFSRNFGFVDPIDVAVDPVAIDAPAFQSFTPEPTLWRQILRLASNPDFREIPIFWRVLAGGSPASPAEAIRTLRVTPPVSPEIVGPTMAVSATHPPKFVWQPNHSERFRLRFSATDYLGPPFVESGAGFHISAVDPSAEACSSEFAEAVCWTPEPALWAQVVALSGSGGAVYWSVHARDALDRGSRSPVQALTIVDKWRTGSNKRVVP